MRLPPALAPWSASMTALAPEAALALGPLVRGIDQLLSSQARELAPWGEPDGFDGLTNRGHPDQLLVSEWLLADEVPEEFLRRAVQRELQYLEPAVRSPRDKGRAAVLADVGPEQAGAGRLVQLACLVVLHRRADAAGVELAVGILGEEPGQWHTGDLQALLKTWLRARRPQDPLASDVAAWLEDADHADEVWIMASPRLAGELPQTRRLITSTESGWDEHGSTHVRVRIDGHGVELPLPPGPAAVRTLRGQGFAQAEAVASEAAGEIRFPCFPSAERVVVARGRADDELVTIRVYEGAEPRLRRLPGPILGASVLGRRVVALVLEDGCLRVHVTGKPLGRLHGLSFSLQRLDLDLSEVEKICAEGLSPLYYQSGDLLWRAEEGGDWWILPPDGRVRPSEQLVTVAAATGRQFDQPAWVTPHAVGISGKVDRIEPESEIVLGGGGYARRTHASTWRIVGPGEPARIEAEGEVLGLAFDEWDPMMLVRNAERLTVARGDRSYAVPGLSDPVAHPTLPWMAGFSDGRLQVVDLRTCGLLLDLEVGR